MLESYKLRFSMLLVYGLPTQLIKKSNCQPRGLTQPQVYSVIQLGSCAEVRACLAIKDEIRNVG